jgi:hypothetical protein
MGVFLGKLPMTLKTFGWKNLKLAIVRRRCIAPYGGCVSEYRADQYKSVSVVPSMR